MLNKITQYLFGSSSEVVADDNIVKLRNQLLHHKYDLIKKRIFIPYSYQNGTVEIDWRREPRGTLWNIMLKDSKHPVLATQLQDMSRAFIENYAHELYQFMDGHNKYLDDTADIMANVRLNPHTDILSIAFDITKEMDKDMSQICGVIRLLRKHRVDKGYIYHHKRAECPMTIEWAHQRDGLYDVYVTYRGLRKPWWKLELPMRRKTLDGVATFLHIFLNDLKMERPVIIRQAGNDQHKRAWERNTKPLYNNTLNKKDRYKE